MGLEAQRQSEDMSGIEPQWQSEEWSGVEAQKNGSGMSSHGMAPQGKEWFRSGIGP